MFDYITGKGELKRQNAELEAESTRKEKEKREIEARAQKLETELEKEKSKVLREMQERQQKEREMVKDHEEARKALEVKQRAEKHELEEKYKVELQQKIQQEQAYQAELKRKDEHLKNVKAENEELVAEKREAEERKLKEPWRLFPKNGGWNHEYHTKLAMDIKEQVAHESVKKARLLFVGPIHAGKSSFINAVASIDKERIATPMECGESTKSLSKKVKTVQTQENSEKLYFDGHNGCRRARQ